ncbi:DoxX family protein [Phycicoccus endophyticus]|uniref:DoxX family protein n=1 Tax=Phycicoccus endophyticus TaxID=1690220 RepID=A0A7G9R1M7_9MICO|nr:DoxX family protein [Phycicoccus endophyticus]NHI18709.1 DoxX family protein [Phycicoccus endophyticus]QNN49502.1 DoxX family protein [Phycicoccus endophyticus]GGL37053.1 doxX subfamily protein [Phycicoccus endophyticus]
MDLDLGMLVLRLALGPMLLAHGANKVWGGGGLSGTAGWFEALGLRPGWLHARVAAVTEMGAGVLVTLGLLTGPAVAAVVGLMTVAGLTDHRGKGYFVFRGGWEYVLLVAVCALALAVTGPGGWSLDAVLDLTTSGPWWGLAAAVVGLLAAGGLLAVFHRPVPDEG